MEEDKTYDIVNKNDDMNRLLSAMDAFVNGNFYPIDVNQFDNPEIGEKYNAFVNSAMNRNNHYLMRINDAMIRIGNSSSVKDMFEQIEAQRDPIKILEVSKNEFGPALKRIEEMDIEILALSRQVSNTITPCTSELQECYALIDLSDHKMDDVISKTEALRHRIESNNDIPDEAKENIFETLTELEEECANAEKTLEQAQISIRRETNTFDGLTDRVLTITENVNKIYLEIEARLGHVEAFLGSVDAIANSYEQLSVNCFNAGRHLYRISRDIDNARNDMYRMNSTPTVHDALKVFAVDHLTLTWRLYNNIIEFEQLRIAQVNNPDGCKFGLWCKNQTDPVITQSDSFKHAMEAHYELHNHAVASFIAKESSNEAEAIDEFLQALVALEQFHVALDELHDYLRENGITDETEVWKFTG